MRAWKVTGSGEPREIVTLEEKADTVDPGRKQVKVRVEAAGLGLPDVLMCRNTYPLTPPLPFVPSQEAAGRIVAVGASVDDAMIGRRVLGPTLFQAQGGGLADDCLMSAKMAFEIPDGMSGEEAAGFFIPYQTAWVGLVHRAKLTAEDSVLILGASGSSGCAAVQLAKAVGARVIATAGGPDKSAFCRSLGADAVIDYHQEDITGAARELTDGKGVNVVFDPVGGKPGRAAFKATAFEGRFVVIGFASGEWARIDLSETLLTNISLVGAMPIGYPPEFYHEAHRKLMDHWRQGKLKVVGNQVFEFEDGLKAIEHIAAGKVEGKVVVRINS
ncbi:MAG: NADPH:quinone oxidoreductase family protein [Proteobacteria bacterium]|nr:NADPH:quinone oxidoreductase family protein [Pseudomonadota bacterium]